MTYELLFFSTGNGNVVTRSQLENGELNKLISILWLQIEGVNRRLQMYNQ